LIVDRAACQCSADLPAGAYALICFADNLPTWRVHSAAQLDATG